MTPRIPALAESPYSRSAFRLLGVSAMESSAALLARARELIDAPATRLPARPPGDFPWLPEVRQGSAAVRAAAEVLARPEARLRERLFWPHACTEVDRQALEAAWAGRFEEAEDLWSQAWRDDQGARTTAAHNLAVLYHSRALSAPRGLKVAARDLDLARRWWLHVVDGGRLTAILMDGEDPDLRTTGVLGKAERLVAKELQDLLAPKRAVGGRGTTGAGHIPLLPGEWEGGSEPAAERYQVRKGKLLAALEAAEEATRRGNRDALEEAIEAARDLVVGPGDGRMVEEAWQKLSTRLVTRGLMPVHADPMVVAVSGLGTALVGMDNVDPASHSYESRLMFTVAHLPVLPLGRYRLRERPDGSLEFIGRLPLDGWTLVHALISAGFVMVFLWGAVHLTVTSGHRLDHLLGPGGIAVTGPAALSPQELQDLERSHDARVAKIEELDREVRVLREEQRELRSRTIPQLLIYRDRAAATALERDNQLRDIDDKIEKVRQRQRKIPTEIQTVLDVRREIMALDRSRR